MVKRPLEVIKEELKINFDSFDWLGVALAEAKPYTGDVCGDLPKGYKPSVSATDDVLLLRGALENQIVRKREQADETERRRAEGAIRALKGLLQYSMSEASGFQHSDGELRLCNIGGHVLICVPKLRRVMRPASRATT